MLIWKTCEKRKFDLHLQSSFNGLWNGAKSLEIKLNWKQNVPYFLDMVLFCAQYILYAVTRICSVKKKILFCEWMIAVKQAKRPTALQYNRMNYLVFEDDKNEL